MKGVRNILRQVLAVRFYRINAGFFLLVFLLLFGIISPKESLIFQYNLMKELGHSAAFFAAAVVAWTLYAIKCLVFCLQALDDPQHSFFAELQGVSRGRQLGLLLYAQVLLYLPALLYAVIASVIIFLDGHMYAGFLVLLVQVLLCLGGAGVYALRINHNARQGALNKLWTALRLRSARPRRFLLYLAGYSLQHRKTTLLTLKSCSLVLLQLMVWLNEERLQPEGTYFFTVLVITAHALMPFYYVLFTEQDGWLRNLPVPLYKWGFYYAFTYALLFLPELLFLLLHTRHSLQLPTILSLYALAIAQLCCFTAVLYIPRLPIDRYTQIVFGAFLATMLLLAAIGIWPLIALLCCLAAALFISFFYRYEEAN